ncbi:MAG: V-type ATP synthase subunit I [Candidatus Diapherotrites archaeon]|nr:V-type ATP synthase subunit I [Candidatus Diapherotrites archaeon]
MFRPARMLKVNAILPKECLKKTISLLHEKGVCELVFEESKNISVQPRVEAIKISRNKLAHLKNILSEFKPVLQPESFIKKLFYPNKPTNLNSTFYYNEDILTKADMLINILEEKIKRPYENFIDRRKKLEEIEEEKKNLSFLPRDIETIYFSDGKNYYVSKGLVFSKNVAKIKDKLQSCFLVEHKINKEISFLAVFYHSSKKDFVDKTLHLFGFESINFPLQKNTPAEILDMLDEEKKKVSEELNVIFSELENISKEFLPEVDFVLTELDINLDREIAIEKTMSSNSFCMISAWVPRKNFNYFLKIIEDSEGYFLEAYESDNAPTLLDNPKILKPFEILVELYSLPKYKDFDPTPIVAFTFMLFFGFMLSDFFYGLVLAITAFAIFNGAGKYDKALKKLSAMFLGLGISTLLFGFIFSSYFGDFFARIGFRALGLVDPIRDVILVIELSIAIGVLHILVGLIVGFYNNIKRGFFSEAFSKQGSLIFFIIGIFLLFSGGLFIYLALFCFILAVLINFYFKSKDGVILGLLSIFDFTALLGDIFSYARLTALAVGTSGIALAVNFMALLAFNNIPYLGLPIAIFIFFVGHSFNMFMSGLGAFIHSMRLHYLEFFQKFYEGGGVKYKPFSAKIENREVLE